jgi:hypothetical protein
VVLPLRRLVFLIAAGGRLVADRSDASFADGGVDNIISAQCSVIVAVRSVSISVDEVMGIRIRPIAMNFACECRGFVVTQ